MAKVNPVLRAAVKKLAKEFMTSSPEERQRKSVAAQVLLKREGLTDEEALAFWYDLSAEIVEELVGRSQEGSPTIH